MTINTSCAPTAAPQSSLTKSVAGRYSYATCPPLTIKSPGGPASMYGSPLAMENISADQAKQAVGGAAFDAARQASIPSAAELFRRAGNQDIADHKIKYAFMVLSALSPLGGGSEVIHGVVAAFDIVHALHDILQGPGKE